MYTKLIIIFENQTLYLELNQWENEFYESVKGGSNLIAAYFAICIDGTVTNLDCKQFVLNLTCKWRVNDV